MKNRHNSFFFFWIDFIVLVRAHECTLFIYVYGRGWKSLFLRENNTDNGPPEKNVPHVVVEPTLLTNGLRKNGTTALMAVVYYIGIDFGSESVNGNGWPDALRRPHRMIRYECHFRHFRDFYSEENKPSTVCFWSSREFVWKKGAYY